MRFTASTLLALFFAALSTNAFDQPLYARRHLDFSERDIQGSTLDARTISALLEDVLAARDADADAQHSPAAQYGPSKAQLDQTPRSWAVPSAQSSRGQTGNKRRSAASPSTPTKAGLDQTPRSWAVPSSQSPKAKSDKNSNKNSGSRRRSLASPAMFPLEARLAPTTYHPHLARRLAAIPAGLLGLASESGGISSGGKQSSGGGGGKAGGAGGKNAKSSTTSQRPIKPQTQQMSPMMNRIDAECGNGSPTTCA